MIQGTGLRCVHTNLFRQYSPELSFSHWIVNRRRRFGGDLWGFGPEISAVSCLAIRAASAAISTYPNGREDIL
jgi:hypothetical protein